MPLRGVNLGGWLVLEKWMTPTLFAGTKAVDEYTFMQTPGAAAKLRAHHNNFITEADFKWLQSNGVQAVRIPVGYWILDGDAPYKSAIGRLDWAFAMSKKYNLQVLLCLHGAPGSQNGHDHSGQAGKVRWHKNGNYRAKTIDVLEALALRYRDHPQFWGLELLNEPRIGLLQTRRRQFYRQAYRRLAGVLKPHTRIVFHDAFTPRLMNAAIGGPRAMMDIHWYHFTFLLHRWLPLPLYWWLVRRRGQLVARLRHWQPVVIGEWSGVISHQRLRHYPPAQHRPLEYANIARQLAAYQHADAWFYWSYKTEGHGIWDYRWLAEAHPQLFRPPAK